MNNEIDALRAEFDKFVVEKCSINEKDRREKDEENEIPKDELPLFSDELARRLLTPQIAGANISRIDLKMISDETGDNVAVSNRNRMLKAILRHKRNREEIEPIFKSIDSRLNGRILLYREIIEAYPKSTNIFLNYINKIENLQSFMQTTLINFAEIDSDSPPISFDS